MEWIAVITWGLVVACALPLARGAGDYPLLGLAAIAAVAGFGLCIVFLAVGGSDGVAWGAFAAAIVGLLCVAAGGADLTSDQHAGAHAAQQGHQETEAAVARPELELFRLVAVPPLLPPPGRAPPKRTPAPG